MLFSFDVTVPANTLSDSPVEEAARLVTGDVTRIGILFRDGPAWLVHAVVEDQLHRLVPANPDGTINEDGGIAWSILKYPLTGNPPQLIMKAWSPGTRYQHILTFYFDVEPAGGDTWESMLLRLFSSQVSSSEEF